MDSATARIVEGLRRAMHAENEGRHFYLMAAGSTGDAAGRETFEEMAAEEQRHFEFLKAQLRSLADSGRLDATLDPGAAPSFRGDHPIFSAEILRRVGDAHYEMTALAIGIQLERSAVDFYRGEAAAVSDPIAKSFYEKLATWEQGHLAALQRQADALRETYWQDAHFAPF